MQHNLKVQATQSNGASRPMKPSTNAPVPAKGTPPLPSALSIGEVIEHRDVPELVELAKAYHKECAAPYVPFVEIAVIDQCVRMLQDTERLTMNGWVCRWEGRPIGFAIGTCAQYMFNYDYCAEMRTWYVLPAYRLTQAPLLLLRAFEEWARLRGALQIFAGVSLENAERAAKIGNLFPKIGYEWSGSFYLKRTASNGRVRRDNSQRYGEGKGPAGRKEQVPTANAGGRGHDTAGKSPASSSSDAAQTSFPFAEQVSS